jgi:cytochrome c biogenesis protein CcmG/thiol:disulfide interchange protein DsbE
MSETADAQHERDARRFPWARIVVAVLVVATVALVLKALLTPASANPAGSQTPGPAAPLAGHYAPGATLVDLSGNQIALSSLQGKVVVLNFWYAACEPCLLEMPALERYYQAHKSDGLVVVGVNIADDAPTAKRFVESIGVSYPVFRDPDQRVYTTYQVNKTPSSFIIDRNGVIRQVVVGPLDTATLDQAARPLLRE